MPHYTKDGKTFYNESQLKPSSLFARLNLVSESSSEKDSKNLNKKVSVRV